MGKRRYIIIVFLVSILTGSDVFCGPVDPENYDVVAGGPIDIPNGSFVEGSSRFGGIQPDYYIDIHSPEFAPLLKKAGELRESNLPLWDKVNELSNTIREKVLPKRDYHDPSYRALLSETLSKKQDVPLSKYVNVGAGVCRENAFLLHLLLKEAGIPNKFVYAHVQVINNGIKRAEDHAFTVVNYQNELWIADSYNRWFHGYKFSDVMSQNGIGPESDALPTAMRASVRRKILKLNNYPKVWVPKNKRCMGLFGNL